MIKLATTLTGLALATSLATMPAAAKDVPSTRVEFGDLDLRTDAGVESLDRRLRRAISRICGGGLQSGALEAMTTQRCRADSLADITPRRDAVIQLARAGQPVRVTRLELKKPVQAH